MSFEVLADAYARFMGRYSEPLADQFVDALDLRDGQRVLDVGCGPGALTERLVRRLGADAVTAVDPSGSFVEAIRSRIPSVEVHRAAAEEMPFADGRFDCAAAQLVVHFMKDPVAGITEMARVTRGGGMVAACVWDYAGETGPLTAFWRAVRALDPLAPDESSLAGAREGHLVELFEQAGLGSVDATKLTVHVPFTSFDEWWGNRSPSVSDRPASMSLDWTPRAGPHLPRSAPRYSPPHRSRSPHRRGRQSAGSEPQTASPRVECTDSRATDGCARPDTRLS